MRYSGKIQNGVVVLPPDVRLPDGTQVRVEVEAENGSLRGGAMDDVYRMSELAVETGIPDLATNIDHYLYGHPKASDGR